MDGNAKNSGRRPRGTAVPTALVPNFPTAAEAQPPQTPSAKSSGGICHLTSRSAFFSAGADIIVPGRRALPSGPSAVVTFIDRQLAGAWAAAPSLSQWSVPPGKPITAISSLRRASSSPPHRGSMRDPKTKGRISTVCRRASARRR